MPTDLNGTPTSLGIGTYNTSIDAPSGLGFNEAMAQIDALIAARVAKPAGIAAGDVPVWNGTAFVVPSGTRDGTKFLRDDGSWQSAGGGATVATTAAGLGTATAGKIGLIRAGATPFEFLALVYDATYGKWVSPAVDLGLVAANVSSNSASDVQIGRTAVGVYGPYVTAGLTLQMRALFQMTESGTGETGTGGIQIATQAANSAIGSTGAYTATFGAASMTAVSGSPVLGDTGWVSPVTPPTSAAFFAAKTMAHTSAIANAKSWDAQLLYRWVA